MIIKGRAIIIAGQPGASNTLTIGTVTTLPAGSSATATISGTSPNQVLNLGIPIGSTGTPGTAGSPGPANTLTIGTVTTLPVGSSATATITGTAPNQTLNLGIPVGATGAQGVGLSPGTGITTAVTLGVAFRATDTTKPHFLSVMIDVAYSITLAATLADVVELWVGPVSADVASGNTATAKRVASFRSSLTGIAVSIGMGSGDRGQLTWLVPAGHYCAVRRTTGTTATISEVFMQPLT